MATLALRRHRPPVFVHFHNWAEEPGTASGLQRVLFREDLERPPWGPDITNAPRLIDLVPGIAMSATNGFQCGLCEALMEEPATLGCQHHFCRSCILGCLGVRGQSYCPAQGCGKKYYRHTVDEPSPVQQEVDGLLRRCIQGVSWDCARDCYKDVPDLCSFVGSKLAVENHQKDCLLRPVELLLVEGGEQVALPYKDLPAVLRERVPRRAEEGTGNSISAGPTLGPHLKGSAASPARLKTAHGRVLPHGRAAAAGNRDPVLQQRVTIQTVPQAPCSGAQVVPNQIQIADNQGRRPQNEGLLSEEVEEKMKKLESDKRRLKLLWEREAKKSKQLEGELQQAAAQHGAALAKGARAHKEKERAWGAEKEELLASLETRADQLSTAQEQLRQKEARLAREVRRLEEGVEGQKRELQDRRNEWNAEKEGLETELADARADVERSRRGLTSAQEELERVSRDLERERRERTELREMLREDWFEFLGVQQLEAELNDEITLVRRRDEEIAHLESELRDKKRERDSLRSELGKAKELCEWVHLLEGGVKRGQCAQGDAWSCVVEEARRLFNKGPEDGHQNLRRKRRRH